MRSKNLISKLAALVMVLFLFNGNAQQQYSTQSVPYQQIFSPDSLEGFDEDMAIEGSKAAGCYGSEFKVYMSRQKRAYINAKYNIRESDNGAFKGYIPTVQAAACVNEDFEASAAGNITSSGQITGWTINQGTNSGSSTSCNPNPFNAQPNNSQLFNVPGGLIDPIIGAGYPIFSVFGSGAQNGGTAANLTNIPQGCYGNNFIRINNSTTGDYSMVKLSKTIAVTSSNALFRFAFIAVMNTGHACCDAGAFQIRLLDGCGSNSVMSCPNFSSAAAPNCGQGVTYIPIGSLYLYNKWFQSTLDLTSKIGCNVTIEVIATDCNYGGHFGYVYFDSQCLPMDIIGNGNSFPAGTPKITLPTCGATGANITAPTGLGPYLWQGPSSWVANPSYTAQTVLNVPGGTYTLTMTPPGACAPITRTITVVNTPSPSIVVTVTQVTCTNPISKASATLAGSASIPGNTVVWTPAPASTLQVGGITSATNLPTGTGTVTVTDTAGCKAYATYSINPTPIVPTVAISYAPTNTISCAIPAIQLIATGGPPSIAGNLTYSWTSGCGTYTGSTISTTCQGTYQVFCTDANSGCTVSQTVQVYKDVSVATATISPGNQNFQCGVVPTTYTGSPAPLSNYTYQWYLPCGPPLAGYICSPGCVGVYTFEVTNTLNGCKSIKTVTVGSVDGLPNLTITAQANNYYVTCATCVTMQITSSMTGTSSAGIGVQWWSAGGSTLTTSNTFSTCTAGNYIAFAYNLAAPNCSVTQMVTVLSNTTAPTAGFTSTVWGVQNPTLTCYDPCVVLTGTSTAASYSVGWNTPGTIPDATVSVCSTTNTSQTLLTPTYSVVITDLVNGCVKKISTFICDPKTVTLTAKATPSLLTCKVLQSQLQYTNPISALHTWTWTTPSPGTQIPQVNPLDVFGPGTYTLEATNTVNGCKSTQTVNVGLNNLPPAVVPVPDATIACGNATTQISAGVTSTVGNTYFWTEVPNGAAVNPITGGNPTANMVGYYEVTITNTITGCTNINSITVVAGTLTAAFTPDPPTGFAPLTVNFANQTNPSGGSSLWGYGNGTSQSSTTTINGYTQYTSPGTYTVVLFSQKGVCVDSATAVIVVEIPSKLEVPNVFTPNGDGVNDNFILHTANLTDITCTVFDRWGVKMYEVTTDKGNISWDGKTLGGHAATTGTYFWVIKATGKDGQDYNDKGTVTLYK